MHANCKSEGKGYMARLAEEYDGTPYKETYEKLIEEYALWANTSTAVTSKKE